MCIIDFQSVLVFSVVKRQPYLIFLLYIFSEPVSLWPWKVISHVFGKYLANYRRYRLGLYYGHIGNHIWAFILCYDHWPWMTLKGQTCKIEHFAACSLQKSSFKWSIIIKTIDNHLNFNLQQWLLTLKGHITCFSANISKTIRDTDLFCITDI